MGPNKPDLYPREYKPDPPGEEDDIKLYYESWVDLEPNTGAVVRAAQKLMISAYLERDELFDVESKFVPIYYVFRTGNFTNEAVNNINI
jgi:hypothetical protein